MHDWDAVVDVANVCYSSVLPPQGRGRPVWSRLGLIMDAWRDLHGSDVRLALVADDSLTWALDDADAREFLRMCRACEVETRPVADELILTLADDRGLHVITRDHYVDHRRQHRWIEKAPERFHRWITKDGKIRFEPLGITPTSEQSISAALENKDLQWSHRISFSKPRHRAILRRRWRCGNVRCPEGSQWQDELLAWPVITKTGEARCPRCHSPLQDAGPRGPIFEVVAESRAAAGNRTAEILRFPLEPDCPVLVGRGADKGINLQLHDLPPEADVTSVSRRHILLCAGETADGDRKLIAVDQHSRNGTQVERWTGTEFRSPEPACAETKVILSAKDRLVLGGTVTLRLSGRRYIAGITTPFPGLPGPRGSGGGLTVSR